MRNIWKSIRKKKEGLTWGAFIRNGLIFRRNQLLDPIMIPLYRKSIERKVKRLRKKEVITVAFVVPELGVWKTEALYRAMLAHKRFHPQLLIIPSTEVPSGADVVERYFQEKGYDYIDMRKRKQSIKEAVAPDIIFYQKPYDYSLPAWCNFRNNTYAVFCYVTYAYHTMKVRDIFETPLIDASWQVYYENATAQRETEQLMLHRCDNGVVTGLPNSDDFMLPAEAYPNPWKQMPDGKQRKRIIWAPHHSVGTGDHHGMDYSTFLEYADFMLDMAHKYEDKIQLAFKPHPLLKNNLKACWSQQKIDDYYQKWSNMPNTQLELGSYKALFMHSDAMIHDCGSFTIEYLYTHHPVMYMLKHDHHDSNLNEFATAAFRLHYMGENEARVEQFLQDVIEARDTKAAERRQFFNECLQPPHGLTASENILKAILGND